MEILFHLIGSCITHYPEAVVATFDREATIEERLFHIVIFTVGTAALLAITGVLGYIVFHGV